MNFILGKCKCGCDSDIPIRNKIGYLQKYKHGHNVFGVGKNNINYQKGKKGQDHHNWKGGRYKRKQYWLILMPNYFCCDKRGYVLEHIYFFQEYNKCCLLPWGIVHHKEPVTPNYCNNMPWNLQGMMASNHTKYHHVKDMSDRYCKLCGSDKTFINKKTGYHAWYGNKKDGFICMTCHNRLYRRPKLMVHSL